MKVKNYLLIIGCLLISGLAFGQGKALKKANALYKLNQFSEAIPLYESAIAKKSSLSAKTKLAYCYRMTNKMAQAAQLYGEIVQEERSTTISKFYYGETLMGVENYDEARVWLEKYLAERPDDKQAKALIKACKEVKYIQPYFQDIKVKRFTQNSENDDSAPILYKDGIVFCSDRKQGAKLLKKKSGWTGRDFLSVYFSKKNVDDTFEPAKSFSGKINELNKNTGPVTFNREGTEIIYTQNSSVANKRDQYPMQLYYATSEDGGKWKGKELIPFCSPNYNFMHPALSPDGQRLFFVADKKGGEGGTDILMSERTDRGWTRPKNLGNVVNTASNEAFPFVHEDGKLYFSSKGHVGYGGFDIFFTEQQADGSWSTPVNVGKPINSSSDDISIAIAADSRSGAFSSSRKNGDDDIYLFKTSGGSSAAPYSITLVEEEPLPVATSQEIPASNTSTQEAPPATSMQDNTTEAVDSPAATPPADGSTETPSSGYAYDIQPPSTPNEGEATKSNMESTGATIKSTITEPVQEPVLAGNNPAVPSPESIVADNSSSSQGSPTVPAVETDIALNNGNADQVTPTPSASVPSSGDVSTPPVTPPSDGIIEDPRMSHSPSPVGESTQEITIPIQSISDATPPSQEKPMEEMPTSERMTKSVDQGASVPATSPETTNVSAAIESATDQEEENSPMATTPINNEEENSTPVTTPSASPAVPTPPSSTTTTRPNLEAKRINTAPTLFEGTVEADSWTSGSTLPAEASLTVNNYLDLGEALSGQRATVGQTFRLPNITFAFDALDYQINNDIATQLNKLADILKEHPQLKVEVGGHTSSFGEDKVSLEVSRERAQAAVDYLIGQGIDSNRLVARGYGETQPQNHCVNGVLCTREEHLVNQRLEIKVLEN